MAKTDLSKVIGLSDPGRRGMISRVLILGLLLPASIGCGDGADPEDALFERAKATLASGGPTVTVAELFSGNDPVDATRTVNRLVLHLYWEKKDLSRCLTVGRMGVGTATEAAKADPDRRSEIRRLIFEISSNLASCTWPGWGHVGIRIRKADREVGLKAARHALTLARELELPDERLARAYWLIGAHAMLAGEGDAVVGAMSEARRLGDDRFRSFVRGTMAIGAACMHGTDLMTRDLFDSALRDLEIAGGEESERYAAQLRTAWRVLVPDADRPSAVTVEAGPVTLEIIPGRAAQHFAVVAHLARGLYPADAFPLVDEDRKRLDRFAGLLARKPDLGGFFCTREAPTAALFDAAGAGLITPNEVTDLSEMFQSLRDRIDSDLRGWHLDGEAFAPSLDRKRIRAVAAKASKFTSVKTLRVEVWPIPAEPGKPRCRYEDGRIVVEVNRKVDPTADLVYGIARAFLSEREQDVRTALQEVSKEVGHEVPEGDLLDVIAALIVEGGEAAEARNVRSTFVLGAFRLTMENEDWLLNYEDPDPLAAFLRKTVTLPATTRESK